MFVLHTGTCKVFFYLYFQILLQFFNKLQ